MCEGSGLGLACACEQGDLAPERDLAIVRGVASAHGGAVDVENVGPGCRFTLELSSEPAGESLP